MSQLVLDVSNRNPITEQDLRRADAAALIAKATEGTTYQDPTLPQHRAAAKAVGIPLGMYVFLHQSSTGSEAQHFLDYAKPRPGDIAPIIDCEVTDGQPMSAVAKRCNACATALEHAGYTGKAAPILYSSASFLKQLYAEQPALKRLRVWEAQYPGRFTRWFPGLARLRYRLANGATVVMWQWTSTYALAGRGFDASRLLVKLDSIRIPAPAV